MKANFSPEYASITGKWDSVTADQVFKEVEEGKRCAKCASKLKQKNKPCSNCGFDQSEKIGGEENEQPTNRPF